MAQVRAQARRDKRTLSYVMLDRRPVGLLQLDLQQGAQEDGQQDSGSGESEDQNAEGDGSLTPEISEKSDQQDNKKKEDVSRSGKSPNTEDTVVQCLIWGAVLVTAGGTGTVLALRRRPRRSRSRRR